MIIPKNDVPISANLGVHGVNVITAYAELVVIFKPKKGNNIVVTTAAGSVGSAVGKIAKIYGRKTRGLTSSNEKKFFCLNEFKYDNVINFNEIKDISLELKK